MSGICLLARIHLPTCLGLHGRAVFCITYIKEGKIFQLYGHCDHAAAVAAAMAMADTAPPGWRCTGGCNRLPPSLSTSHILSQKVIGDTRVTGVFLILTSGQGKKISRVSSPLRTSDILNAGSRRTVCCPSGRMSTSNLHHS